MTRRARRTLPALIVALLLVAAGVVVTLSAVQMLLGRTPLLAPQTVIGALSGVTWGSSVTLAVAGVAAVLGLALLGAAVVPGRTHVLPLTVAGAPAPPGAGTPSTPEPGVGLASAGWHRSDLAVRVRRRAEAVEGVSSARVNVRRGRVRVRARTHRTAVAPLGEVLTERLGTDLDALGLVLRPRLRVTVSSTRKDG